MPDWSARLNELAVAAEVPGAVLGIWHDGETTIAPYGVVDAATGVETTADSLFQIGSAAGRPASCRGLEPRVVDWDR